MKKLIILVFTIFMLNASTGKTYQNEITGDILEAKCDCGYTQDIFAGGGKFNFKHYVGFPFICKSCQIMFTENYLNEYHSCPTCGSTGVLPYDDESIRIHFSDNAVFGWNLDNKKYVLTDDYYLCPHCLKYALRFSNAGNWD